MSKLAKTFVGIQGIPKHRAHTERGNSLAYFITEVHIIIGPQMLRY